MEHHLSPEAPAPGGPYSHAVSAHGLVFLSGQRPQHPETGEIPAGVAAQARQVIENLIAVLNTAGCTTADVLKVTVYLADIAYFDAFNAVYREYFTAPYPARTTIACVLRGIEVEVDVVAAVSSAGALSSEA
jgi:2-iminobutanoate/2-iminopropanoate deaminase